MRPLFTDPAWEGLDRWRTRFGIHRAEVTVGHVGAPAILAANTDDPPSRVLTAHCRLYMQKPPRDDWMGVFVAHQK